LDQFGSFEAPLKIPIATGFTRAFKCPTTTTDETGMTHSDFLELRSEGLVKLGVSPSVALSLIKYLPRRYQAAHAFWSWVLVLSIPAAFVLWYFTKWYWGLLSLFFTTPIINESMRKSACQFVMEHATKDPEFFESLFQQGLITVVNKH
jgi:hypothetical protein